MEDKLATINQLSNELQALGYRQYQIDSIVEEVTGNKDLTSISGEEAQCVVEELKSYISFAQKCRKSLYK